MTIRNRLQLFSIITLAVMLITAVLLYSSYQDFQVTNRHLLQSLELQRLATERVLLRDEYLVNSSPLAAQQWQTKNGQVAGILQTMERDFTGPEERELVRTMKAAYQVTFTEFSKVLAARRDGYASGYDRGRLTMILVKAYELYENTHQLSLLHQKQVETSISRFFTLIAVTLFSLSLLVWINAAMLNRLIMNRVLALHQGAASISGGDLDFRIVTSGSDELNDLSDSFNKMASRLKQDIIEREEVEGALLESEERFRHMFEKHEAVMFLIEPVSGNIIDANRAAEKYYGYPLEKLKSMSIYEINMLPPEQVAEERMKAAHEERNYFVFPHRLANGEIRTVEVHSSPIDLQGQPILFSIIHDITERMRMEGSIRKLTEELEERVQERTAELEEKNRELERFNKLFVNRELKMIELKERIRELEKIISKGGKS